MTQTDLERYVESLNFWKELQNKPLITFPLSRKNVAYISYHLEGDLSPENLHCDGEITSAEANRKYRYYMRVIDQLHNETEHLASISINF